MLKEKEKSKMDFYSLSQKSEEEVKALNINLFELNIDGYTIFNYHKYSESFLLEHAEKYGVNLFDVKDIDGDTMFHRYKHSESFLREQAEKYGVNLFDVKNNYGITIFHCRNYSESFLKELLHKNPTNLFEMKDTTGCNIFEIHDHSKEFIEYCKNQKYCGECLCRKCEYHF